MDVARIKELKLARPFRAFYILLRDGNRVLVRSSYNVAVAPDGSRVGVTHAKGVTLLHPDEVRDVDVTAPALR